MARASSGLVTQHKPPQLNAKLISPITSFRRATYPKSAVLLLTLAVVDHPERTNALPHLNLQDL